MLHRALYAALAVTAFSLVAQADASSFDREAANQALSSVNLQVCKPKGKKAKAVPTGEGHVIVTYSPNGKADYANVDSGPFAGTPTATCIESQYKRTRVPPFDGTPISVGKKFKFE